MKRKLDSDNFIKIRFTQKHLTTQKTYMVRHLGIFRSFENKNKLEVLRGTNYIEPHMHVKN